MEKDKQFASRLSTFIFSSQMEPPVIDAPP